MTAPVRKMTRGIGNMTESAERGMRKIAMATDAVGDKIGSIGSHATKSTLGLAAVFGAGTAAIAKQADEVNRLTEAMGGNQKTIGAIASEPRGSGSIVEPGIVPIEISSIPL